MPVRECAGPIDQSPFPRPTACVRSPGPCCRSSSTRKSHGRQPRSARDAKRSRKSRICSKCPAAMIFDRLGNRRSHSKSTAWKSPAPNSIGSYTRPWGPSFAGAGENWGRQEWSQYVDRSELETWVACVAGTPAGYYELERQADASLRIVCFGLLRQFFGKRPWRSPVGQRGPAVLGVGRNPCLAADFKPRSPARPAKLPRPRIHAR